MEINQAYNELNVNVGGPKYASSIIVDSKEILKADPGRNADGYNGGSGYSGGGGYRGGKGGSNGSSGEDSDSSSYNGKGGVGSGLKVSQMLANTFNLRYHTKINIRFSNYLY